MDFRILIVEDEARLREVVCDYFRCRDASPCVGGNGLGAREQGEDCRP